MLKKIWSVPTYVVEAIFEDLEETRLLAILIENFDDLLDVVVGRDLHRANIKED